MRKATPTTAEVGSCFGFGEDSCEQDTRVMLDLRQERLLQDTRVMLDLRQERLLQTPRSVIFCSTTQIRDKNSSLINNIFIS